MATSDETDQYMAMLSTAADILDGTIKASECTDQEAIRTAHRIIGRTVCTELSKQHKDVYVAMTQESSEQDL